MNQIWPPETDPECTNTLRGLPNSRWPLKPNMPTTSHALLGRSRHSENIVIVLRRIMSCDGLVYRDYTCISPGGNLPTDDQPQRWRGAQPTTDRLFPAMKGGGACGRLGG